MCAAIVESDISFYRHPDCVTSRRANECERALDEQWGFVRGETAYRYEQFYAGSEFRASSQRARLTAWRAVVTSTRAPSTRSSKTI